MKHSVHIAVLDDEADICELLRHYFQSQGFRVSILQDRMSLDQLLLGDPPALVLLDLGLPGEDGFSIARQLREHWDCGVVIITGRGEAIDKIVGLEIGADDYVTKPFDLRELLARVKAVLRRLATQPAQSDDSVPASHAIRFLGWHLCTTTRSLMDPSARAVDLTAGEFDLLVTMAKHRGRVLTRDYLLEQTRGRSAAPFDRTIDVQVARLRRKLEIDPNNPQIIKSVRGVGYVFVAPIEPHGEGRKL